MGVYNPLMILGQTVRAARNRSGPAHEDLVIKTGVGHGPVEVLSSKHIATKLSVVCNPGLVFIIVSCFEDGCLVSPKPDADKAFQPCHYAVDSLAVQRGTLVA